MNKWYKCVCLSLCLCVCPLGQLRLNKQLCLWSKEEPQGSSVYWSISAHRHTKCSHARTEIHTHECPVLLIFYLPRSVAYLTPGVFYSLSLSLCPLCSVLARSQTERNATLCDLSPTPRRGAALDEGVRGQLQSCAWAWREMHVHTHTHSHTHTQRARFLAS